MKPLNKLDLKPDWSGIAAGCSHPHDNMHRDLMHTIDRQEEQLHKAGIDTVPPGDFSWIKSNIRQFGLNKDFVLLAPGGASHRPQKRWPRQNYQKLIQYFVSNKIQVALIGGQEESLLLSELATTDSNCISLAGRTNHLDLFSLARKSIIIIGNDTGPMHIAAASGSKTIVLYSVDSDPALCGQRGNDVTIFREHRVSDISPIQIIKHISQELRYNQT
jgi:ADP-heptose:LPS heptosyltransferase